MKTSDWLREEIGPLDPARHTDAPAAVDEKVRLGLTRARSGSTLERRQGRRPVFVTLAAVAAAGALSLGALFGYQQVIGDSGQGPRVVSPQASLAYPMETARDWVSYGDYVVVLHVKEGSEKVGDIPSDARSRGEGPLTRSGRIIIDKLLHSRKGAKDLPASFTAPLTGYWWDEDTGRQKFAFTGMPRVETGHHYIAVLVWDEDLHGFGIVNHGGVLPYDHGTVGVGEWEGSTHTEPLPDNRLTGVAKRVNGGHLADLQRVLQHAKPYPAAASHPDLSPAQRFQKVQDDATN